MLDTLDLAQVGPDAETWEKVVKKIRTGMMPPSGARRPERAALDGFASELERRLDRAADANAALVTPALHRLNRTEYANAIRDLLALDIDVNVLLPADGSSQGFDNLAEALAVSPSLIQGYVSAAMKISRLAVGDKTHGALAVDVHAAAGARAGSSHRGAAARYAWRDADPPHVPARCGIRLRVRRAAVVVRGIDITLDGEQITVDNPRSFRMKVTAGPHTIGLSPARPSAWSGRRRDLLRLP